MSIRKAFAPEIRQALISGKPPEWREALELLEDHPKFYSSIPLEDLAPLSVHLVVLLTRYHAKARGEYLNPKLIAEVDKYWKILQ